MNSFLPFVDNCSIDELYRGINLIGEREHAKHVVRRVRRRWVIFAAVNFVVLAWVFSGAYARGTYPDSAVSVWYNAQHNAHGQWCCDKADGHDYFGDYQRQADGSVVLEDGTTLPPYMVLDAPNPTGHAVYWFIGKDAAGARISYCFSPGPEG